MTYLDKTHELPVFSPLFTWKATTLEDYPLHSYAGEVEEAVSEGQDSGACGVVLITTEWKDTARAFERPHFFESANVIA